MRRPKSFRIVVTDLNHHVRDFLKRELEGEGYTVFCVNSGIEICNYICNPASSDAIILDPELLYPYGHSLIWEILRQNTSTQILIHTYNVNELKTGRNIHIIEKNASSIGELKSIIKEFSGPKAGI